jgi:hypothetical protein
VAALPRDFSRLYQNADAPASSQLPTLASQPHLTEHPPPHRHLPFPLLHRPHYPSTWRLRSHITPYFAHKKSPRYHLSRRSPRVSPALRRLSILLLRSRFNNASRCRHPPSQTSLSIPALSAHRQPRPRVLLCSHHLELNIIHPHLGSTAPLPRSLAFS